MPQLHQIQMRYVPQEDRVLLRIKTTDRSEFRFWLTRRYVKLLWPVVVKMLETNQSVVLQQDAEAREAVLSFQHEKAIHESDFATKFKEDCSDLPLGEMPVVLARIQLKRNEQGGNVLCMHPEKGKGIELAMNETLLHSFSKLLQDAISRSGWDIELRLSRGGDRKAPVPGRVN